MDKSAWFQAIFLLSLLMALLPRLANLGRSATRRATLAAFGLLAAGLAWALVEVILWLLGSDHAGPR